jgi:hypothetical protein
VRVHDQQLDSWYRTLDHLLEAKEDIEKGLYERLRDLFSLKPDLVRYDITSTYVEGSGPQGLARHGYSRVGNSVFMSSDDLELPRSLDRMRLHEPGPLSDGLTDGPGIGASAPFGRDAAAHERLAAPHNAIFLAVGQQVLARAEEEPLGSHDREDDAKLHPQGRHLSGGGPGAFAREERRGQDDGRNLLRRGDDRMALQDVGLAQHAFRVAEVQLVFPAGGVQLREF